MKEGIDFHIKDSGKYKELTSMLLGGFAAGIAELTARGYKINYGTVTFVGSMLIATTMPKTPKVKKEVKKTPKKEAPVKVIGEMKE
jgi:hypothetical protein